jgi:hypothetical protein
MVATQNLQVRRLQSKRHVASDRHQVMWIERPVAAINAGIDKQAARKLAPAITRHHVGPHLAEFRVFLDTLC